MSDIAKVETKNKEKLYSLYQLDKFKDYTGDILLLFLGHPYFFYRFLRENPKANVYVIEDEKYSFLWKDIKNVLLISIQEFLEKKDLKKFDYIIMNPPYNGSLHLRILEKALTFKSDDGTCICLSPARWIEDPLWKYKKNSDHAKYQETIIDKLSSINFIKGSTASRLFNIGLTSDLAIYNFNNSRNYQDTTLFISNIFSKVIDKTPFTLKDKAEENKINDIRCEIKELCFVDLRGNDKGSWVDIDQYNKESIFENGYNKVGKYWTETRKNNKDLNATFPCSIKFDTWEHALNFLLSCRTNFYRNLIGNARLANRLQLWAMPYMGDYSHVWTDEDYCKFFNLTKEESEFMCKEVEDYREKDFINYGEV